MFVQGFVAVASEECRARVVAGVAFKFANEDEDGGRAERK